MPSEVTIVHLDEDLIAIDKPAGLLSVPGRGPDKQDCASGRVQLRHPGALVVHRLDQATSGLLVFARHLAAQQALSRAFEQRQVQKHYVAVVWGDPGASGLIDLPLNHELSDRTIISVQQQSADSWAQSLEDAFDWLAAEAAATGCGRMLPIHVTPYIMGLPYRIAAFERLLARLGQRGECWFARGDEIVSSWQAQQQLPPGRRE